MNDATNASAGCATSCAAVPSWRRRPSTMTPMRSASAAASRKSWVTSSVGSARAARTSCSSLRTTPRVWASSAESGSSSSRTRGSRASARATATRWRSPPGEPARALVGQVAAMLHAFEQLGHAGVARAPEGDVARARSCAGRARTPGRRGRPSAARAGGRPWRCGVEPCLGRRGRCARGRGAAGRRSPAGPSSCRRRRARRARRSPAPTLRLTPSSNERRPTAMSSSSVSTRRRSCTRAAPRR